MAAIARNKHLLLRRGEFLLNRISFQLRSEATAILIDAINSGVI
jgi:hypothetical protein